MFFTDSLGALREIKLFLPMKSNREILSPAFSFYSLNLILLQ